MPVVSGTREAGELLEPSLRPVWTTVRPGLKKKKKKEKKFLVRLGKEDLKKSLDEHKVNRIG
jgi:hypothetical protein